MAAPTDISPHAHLVSRLRAGDAAAFTQVYTMYTEKLLGWAFNILQDREECMDIVQDVLLSVWLNRETLDIHTSLEGYLFTAVRNQVFKTIRHGKVRERVFEQIERRIWGEAVAENGFAQRDLQARLAASIEDLPEKTREVYRLSREQNLSYQQIAELLSISPKTVEYHLSQALKKIRTSLGDFLPLLLIYLGQK